MISRGRFNKELLRGGVHLKDMRKEDWKTIWIRASMSVTREELVYAWFKLNPEFRKPGGSVVPRAPLPLMPPNALDLAAFAISGSKLYVLGGLSSNRHPHDDVYIIDLDGNRNSDGSNSNKNSDDSNSSSWIKGPSMLYPRANSSCVVVDDKIYVFGGLYFQTHEVMVPFGEVFDPTTSKWKALPQMPPDPDFYTGGGASRARTVNVAAATTMGGRHVSRYIPVHLCGSEKLMGYCLEDNSWFCVDPNFNRISHGLVLVDDVIYSFYSGCLMEGCPIYAYHLPTNRSITVHSNFEGKYCYHLIYIGNNKFWLFSGRQRESDFVLLEVRKNFRGPILDSISITWVSSGELSLDAETYDGIMAA